MRRNNYGNVGRGYLKAADFERFIELNPYIESVELSNNGEPFLNPEITEILRIGREKKVSVSFLNGTNLNILPEVVAEALVAYKVQDITVGIDGATQEVYSKYRRNGDFSQVIENIQLINKYKEKYQSNFPQIHWQYVLMADNECDIAKAKELAGGLGMDIYFKLDWQGEYVPQNIEEVTSLTGLQIFNRKDWERVYERKYTSQMCSQMIFQPQINWDGSVLGCCGNYMATWEGNAFYSDLIHVLNDSMYRCAVVALLRGAYDVKLAGVCKNCNGEGIQIGRPCFF